MRLTLSLLLLFCVALPAHAGRASPKPGRVTEVPCLVAGDQRYALYLPKRYDATRAYPILYCFAPDGNGRAMVEKFQPAAEARGWIVAGSLLSKNGPSEPNDRAAREMLRDTEDRFRLDGKLRVACGFSGGAWVASRLAYAYPERFAGVILIGQGLDPNIQVDPELAIAMTMGDKERRLHELHDVERMTKRGSPAIPGLFETFEGGHGLPPDAWFEKALRWHESTWCDRYDGCSDACVARLRRAVTRRLAIAEGHLEKGRKAHALRELRMILDGFRNWPVAQRKDLEGQIETLEASEEAAAETAARKALVKLATREHKVGSKKAKSLRKRYEKLVAAHAGTPSAEAAATRAKLLR